MKKRVWVLGVSLLALLMACSGCNANDSDLESVTLTISAAASLQDSMRAVGQAYTDRAPGVTIDYNFGSSGALQQQIEQGAPVDVFLSAAPKQMNALEAKALLLPGSRKDLLKNRLVLIVPKAASGIADFGDLTREPVRKIALGEPDSVPAGQYAKEALVALGLYAALMEKFVFAKDVRQVLAYVETGNVDAGFVYATDAKRSSQVKGVAIAPENSHTVIIYPVAIVKTSKNAAAAQAFVQFLTSPSAQQQFEDVGFSLVDR